MFKWLKRKTKKEDNYDKDLAQAIKNSLAETKNTPAASSINNDLDNQDGKKTITDDSEYVRVLQAQEAQDEWLRKESLLLDEDSFKYDKQIAIIVGIDDYSSVSVDSAGPLIDNPDAVIDLETIRSGIADLNFIDARTLYNPSQTKLRLMFAQLKRELGANAYDGQSTLVYFYFSGYGFKDQNDTQRICLNRPCLSSGKSNSSIEQFMFNIGDQLKDISQIPSTFLISVLDYCEHSDAVAKAAPKFQDEERKHDPTQQMMIQLSRTQPQRENKLKAPRLSEIFLMRCFEAIDGRQLDLTNSLKENEFSFNQGRPLVEKRGNQKVLIRLEASLQQIQQMKNRITSIEEGKIPSADIGELTTPTTKYHGKILDGKAHGKGKLEYVSGAENGSKYEGDFDNGEFHGHGTYTWADGQYYTGQFTKGKITGQGRKLYGNKDVLEGMFVDGKGNGQGTCTKNNGDTYTGGFQDNFYHGRGKVVYAKGGYYDGQWERGFATGQGEKKWENGDWFKGSLQKSKQHGHGEMKYANGDSYNGNFSQGKRDGHGTMVYSSGSTYEGTWQNDAKVKGRVDFADGGQHWANYENDKIVGQYKRKYAPSGTILEGTVLNGKVNGQGTYTFASGTVWKGNFIQDLLQGEGTEYKRGETTRVTFRDNKVSQRY